MKIKNVSKILLMLSSVVIFSASAIAKEEELDLEKLANMSLEELMEVQIYSVSKRPEKLSDTAASVYILTSEDIKKSGATSIPEALRLVPGVSVAQSNANTWAISIRGFNRQYSNKLLVLIDGRSVYTPLFSGVYWDTQDYVLEDIARIEVIKGSGGTLWGANAVNGVINIITKEARKTRGQYTSFTAGTGGQGVVEYRYGGRVDKINSDDYYRVYGKSSITEELPSVTNNADNNDDWNKGQAGFRYDFRDWDFNKVTLQGDFMNARKTYPFILPQTGNAAPVRILSAEDFKGGNMMLKWNLPTEKFNTDVQAYIDYSARDVLPVLKQEIVTYDLDVQTQRKIGRHSLIGGAEFRYIQDNLVDSQYLNYTPDESTQSIVSAFLQDKITLVDEKLFLTLGSKIDHNDYTRTEFQPNARISYNITEDHTLWAAVSRAVRTPSRGENGLRLAPTGFAIGNAFQEGSRYYDSEKLHSYEIGYRGDITKDLFFDISTFYNKYYDLRTFELTNGAPLTLTARNNGWGESYGVETYAIYGVTKKWDLKLGHTFLLQNFHENTTDTSLQRDEERTPENQFTIGNYVKLADNVNWDSNLYYVSNLHYFSGASRRTIPAYARLDTQIRWQPYKNMELSLIGQNLTDDKHQEFDEVIYSTPSYMSRAFLARISYKW